MGAKWISDCLGLGVREMGRHLSKGFHGFQLKKISFKDLKHSVITIINKAVLYT